MWRVDAEGIASVIAGTTRKASDGDGGTARLASLNAPIDLAIQRQGSRVFLLVAEFEGGATEIHTNQMSHGRHAITTA